MNKNIVIDKKRIALEKILYFITFIIISIIILYLSFLVTNTNSNYWLTVYTILAILQLIVNLFFITIIGEKIFSISSLFILFTFVFHFGHLVLIAFNISADRPFDVINMVSRDIFKDAILFVSISQMFLTIGISIPWIKDHYSDKNKNIAKDKYELQIVRKIGIVLFIVGIIPTLYIDIKRILLYLGGNYLDTYSVSLPGFIGTIARMSEFGIIMMLIGNKDNQKKSKLILILAILYQTIIMLTGNRGRPLVFVISLIYVYVKVIIKRIKVKNIIIFISLGYLGIVLINFIGTVRMQDIKDTYMLLDLFFDSLKASPIFDALGEFGCTMITLCYSLIYLSGSRYGLNYITSLFVIFPNIGGVLNSLNHDFIFITNFPQNARTFLGGSYLAELFYSFDIFGCIAVIIIGIAIGKLSNEINKSIINEKWLNLSLYIIFFPNLLWWVRSYFSDMIREVVWTTIFILILYKLIKSKVKLRGDELWKQT